VYILYSDWAIFVAFYVLGHF